MDLSEFLKPLPNDGFLWNNFSEFNLSSIVHTQLDSLPTEQDFVLFSLVDYQDEHWNQLVNDVWFQEIRNHLYSLSKSNWKGKIYDLGTVLAGNTFEDTCFAIHQIVTEIRKTSATILVIGGSQAFNYVLYKALQKDLVKVGTIDIKLDIEATSDQLNAENHITKMILDEDHRLLEYVNLGSQFPYIAKEEFDILEQLNFENIRLGNIVEDIKIVEPMLRDLDLLSIDMNVMQYSAFSSVTKSTPNGLQEREICRVMNYAGFSTNLKLIHIANFSPSINLKDSMLIAEMLWYFIESRENTKSDGEIDTYRIQSNEEEIVFLHSKVSDKWWLLVQIDEKFVKIPCLEQDYLDAIQGEIPHRWLRYFKKFY